MPTVVVDVDVYLETILDKRKAGSLAFTSVSSLFWTSSEA
jgi:hypothetical protein